MNQNWYGKIYITTRIPLCVEKFEKVIALEKYRNIEWKRSEIPII